jgi:hypothetical protein
MSPFVTENYITLDPDFSLCPRVPLPGKISQATASGYQILVPPLRLSSRQPHPSSVPQEVAQKEIPAGEEWAPLSPGCYAIRTQSESVIATKSPSSAELECDPLLMGSNKIYAVLRPDDFVLRNQGRKSVTVLYWPLEAIQDATLNIEQSIVYSTGVRPFAAAFDYLCANNSRDRPKGILGHETLFPASLHQSIKVFSVQYPGQDSRDPFRLSLTPLPVETIKVDQIESAIQQNPDRFLFFFKSHNYVEDVNAFLYHCHRHSRVLQRDGLAKWTYESDPQVFAINTRGDSLGQDSGFSTDFPVKDLNSTNAYERFTNHLNLVESFNRSLGKVFTFNVKRNVVPPVEGDFSHLVSVCAGTYPIKLVEVFGLCDKPVKMLDQNYASIQFWKLLVSVKSESEMVNLFLAFNDWPVSDVSRVKQQIERTYGHSSTELFRSLRRMRNVEFHWVNFIEHPEVIEIPIPQGSRPLIWLSNSFESRINRLIYGDEELRRRYSQLVASIENQVGGIFEPQGDHCGIFQNPNQQSVAVLLSDNSACWYRSNNAERPEISL